ncbi:MAG: hypothetical protein AAFU53_05705 [Cyanobacteria bacterium J06632_3]
MAKPAYLRYLPARLKPLSNPAVWAPLSVFTLLSIFIWEYHNNPEFFNRRPLGSVTPQSDLTPEEEARLAEIDNLDVLLEGSRVSGDVEAVTSQINPDAPNQDSETGVADLDTPLSEQENPFAAYEAEYQFPSASNAGNTASTGSGNSTLIPSRSAPASAGNNAAGASGGSSFNFGNGLVNPSAPNTNSALSEALNRQAAERQAEAAREGNPSPENGALPSANQPVTAPVNASPVPTSNVPTTFIPTTPNMSPPVGTTGYQTPASSSLPTFNVAPQQATPSPFAVPPAAIQGGTQIQNGTSFAVPSSAVPAAPTQPGTLYTAPAFTQPDQGPAINPRR